MVISGLVYAWSLPTAMFAMFPTYIITVPTGLDYFMVPWPFALMHCWELLLTPHVTQTADFGHLARFS